MQCRKNIKIEVGNTTGYSQLSSVRKLNQNENGSKNSILWLRFPKRLFCGINHFQIFICYTMSQFAFVTKGRDITYSRN